MFRATTGKLMKCRICGRFYEFVGMMVGDQSMCGGCRAAASKTTGRPDTDEEKERRRRFFGTGGWFFPPSGLGSWRTHPRAED